MDKFTKDYLKAVRRQNREEEIELYGKQINYNHIKKSKKAYKRTKFKYDDEY